MIRIITESSCDLTPERAGAIGVELIYMKLTFGEEEYIDKVTITNEEFYRKLETTEEMPGTTLINTGEFIEIFDRYPEDDLIVLTISSKLGGTFHAAGLAKEQCGRENIYIIDSRSVSAAMGLLVQKAAQIRDTGASAEEIYRQLLSYRDRLHLIAVVDTLKYLIKGGRLSKATGYIGNVLNIKPILLLSCDGEPVIYDKVRGFKNALKKIKQYVEEKLPPDENEIMGYGHADAPEGAKELKALMGLEGDIYTIGSIVGSHAGPGTVGMAYFSK